MDGNPLLSLFGLAVLPPWPVFAAFALAGLMLNLVPGADMAFVTNAAARGGRRQGMIAAVGIGAGTLAHIAAAVVGLSALLAASATAFEVMRWLGVTYLLWVAIAMARSGGDSGTETLPGARSWRLFRDAALVNLLNPKVALFFLAFLPQFVPPGTAHPAVMIAGLGLWFDLVGTLINIGMALLVAATARRWAARPALCRAARYVAAGMIGGLAVRLALARR